MSEETATTSSTRTSTPIWPTFVYRDAAAAIDFLIRAFGFTELARYTDGDVIAHAELAWPGGGGIMLGQQRPDMALHDHPAGTGSTYIVVDDPDGLYHRAKSAGATITREPVDQDYGSREFTCRDPEGAYWTFGTYAGATGEK